MCREFKYLVRRGLDQIGVRVNGGGDPYNKENISHIKYKSLKYHHDCGNASRKQTLKKWTKRQASIEKTRPATQEWR
ncbi:unnamed protein product [Diamesa tonsa]